MIKRPGTSIPLLLAPIVLCLVAAFTAAAKSDAKKGAVENGHFDPVIKDIEGWNDLCNRHHIEQYGRTVAKEYRGNVIAVDSGPYYELELSDIYCKRRMTGSFQQRVKKGEATAQKLKEEYARYGFGDGELSAEYHYLGSGKILNDYPQQAVSSEDYFETLKIYTKSQRLKRDDGTVVPWIDENLNPQTGDWISRSRLKAWKNGTWDAGKGGVERGKDYNHSSYCDLIITGLVGLRPREDDIVEFNPLAPAGEWEWFCLDNLLYHGRNLTILWDKSGTKYGNGSGLRVFADGVEIGASKTLGRITALLPPK